MSITAKPLHSEFGNSTKGMVGGSPRPINEGKGREGKGDIQNYLTRSLNVAHPAKVLVDMRTTPEVVFCNNFKNGPHVRFFQPLRTLPPERALILPTRRGWVKFVPLCINVGHISNALLSSNMWPMLWMFVQFSDYFLIWCTFAALLVNPFIPSLQHLISKNAGVI